MNASVKLKPSNFIVGVVLSSCERKNKLKLKKKKAKHEFRNSSLTKTSFFLILEV